jgi:hypothetical protein
MASCGQQPASIKFKTLEVEDFIKHPHGMEDYQGLRFTIRFTYPSQYGDKAVLEKLQRKFIAYVFGEHNAALSPEEAINALVEGWKTEYAKEIKDETANSEWLTGWHITCSDTILFVNDALVQMQTEDGLYPYAAHVWVTSTCHLFNLKTGEEYTRDDVFKPEAAESIRRLIIPELLESTHFSQSELQRFNIWNTETNFAVTGEGILIVYNTADFDYDIIGYHSLTIPYAKIFPFLRKETPVWNIAKQNLQEVNNP